MFLPLICDGVVLLPRSLKDAPAQVIRLVLALAASPHAAFICPAADPYGTRIFGVHGSCAMLVVTWCRQAVLKIDGAARAEIPLHGIVPASVVVWVGGAHCFLVFLFPEGNLEIYE